MPMIRILIAGQCRLAESLLAEDLEWSQRACHEALPHIRRNHPGKVVAIVLDVDDHLTQILAQG